MFNKRVDERKDEIIELTEKINFDDLTNYYKGNWAPQKFDNFDNAFILFDKIKNGKIILQDTKANQNRFRSDINEINNENPKKIK